MIGCLGYAKYLCKIFYGKAGNCLEVLTRFMVIMLYAPLMMRNLSVLAECSGCADERNAHVLDGLKIE